MAIDRIFLNLKICYTMAEKPYDFILSFSCSYMLAQSFIRMALLVRGSHMEYSL